MQTVYFMQASDTESNVPRQSCEWLGEVALRLSLVIEVIDAHNALVCPVGSSLDAAAIRKLITSSDASLQAATSEAMRSRTPVPLVVEGLQALCFALTPAGLLLIARRPAADESIEDCRRDLESIGAWLTSAIEASLGQPTAIGVEQYRIMSIRRILREATSRGSIRKVIGAFVEALSVWDDVRVSGYAAAASDGFFQYIPTMSAPPRSLPDQLDATILPRAGRIVRLPREEADRLELASEPGDTLLLRIGTGTDVEWALVLSGMIDDRVEVRLRVYADILRESLNDILTMTTSRLVAEVGRRQHPQNESLESAAQTALGQVSAAVGGRHAALAVMNPDGRQLLSIGEADLLSGLDQSRLNRLIVRVSDVSGVMVMAVDREQMPFTVFEREIIQAGAAAMHPWVRAAVQRANESERRQSFRPVDTLFDQLAREATAAGHHATVIVMSMAGGSPGPSLLSAWLGRIRGQLRGGDRAGILSDREIAVLLHGASSDQAAIVSLRLKRLFDAEDAIGDVLPAFGMITRIPDAAFEGSLVGAARASATAKALR